VSYARGVKSDVPDVLAPGLRIVFCGINPGRVSAAAGAHYANPRNDFWRLLHAARLTPTLLAPAEQRRVLELGLGLTNAAARTTAGSGDLRRADFASAASRLAELARRLRPAWIAFVGKAAYQGAFGERAEHGVQQRRLGDTRLFVLPSTSPANAAVPWAERERWFQELAGRASGLPLRPAARAVVLDAAKQRVLLVCFEFPKRTVWALPGGGIEPGETPEIAIARELVEEVGVRDPIGPLIWTREHWSLSMEGWAGQGERIYLVQLTRGSGPLAPTMTAAELAAEWVTSVRWWTLDELDAGDVTFAPRHLPALLRELTERGPPASPVDVGV
jgi:TDG/mug DNA glycosylase family protein